MYVIIDQSFGNIKEVLGPFPDSDAAVKYVRDDEDLKIDMVVIKEVIPVVTRPKSGGHPAGFGADPDRTWGDAV